MDESTDLANVQSSSHHWEQTIINALLQLVRGAIGYRFQFAITSSMMFSEPFSFSDWPSFAALMAISRVASSDN